MTSEKPTEAEEFYFFALIMIARARNGDISNPELKKYLVEHESDLYAELIDICEQNTKKTGSEEIKIAALGMLLLEKYPNAAKKQDPVTIPSVETSPAPGNEARAAAIKKIVDRELVHDGMKIIKAPEDHYGMELGHLVVIKSCHEGEPDEAVMGIYVGSVPFIVGPNPVFFVPKLNKTLAGYESWWRAVPKADEQLSCDAMRAKYHFTWADIERELEAHIKLLGLDVSVKVPKGDEP